MLEKYRNEVKEIDAHLEKINDQARFIKEPSWKLDVEG